MRAEHGETFCGAAVELQLRRTGAADNFNVAPEHILRVAGTERLHSRFFGRESSSKVNGWRPAAVAIRNLAVREHAPEEAIAVSLDGVGNAVDVGGVDSKADDVGH